ncbi:hypothetical protein PoB_000973400 [Plakobranchus ocellatus]|uniref:Uncharacterized protein n=1 Tax=Plakobranchus ocellatus TaxID=259542 RepID=A0AAV3YMD6_9GAST|nr:hypothetical protein PoB_000973400 [Plakobranchus ocellatus]
MDSARLFEPEKSKGGSQRAGEHKTSTNNQWSFFKCKRHGRVAPLRVSSVERHNGVDGAVPLRKIGAEMVPEALADIYSLLDVPEGLLSDQGT